MEGHKKTWMKLIWMFLSVFRSKPLLQENTIVPGDLVITLSRIQVIYPQKSPSGTGDWAWQILSMNSKPVRCCSVGGQLGPHSHPEELSVNVSSVSLCLPIHGACPRQRASTQHLWSVASLPRGRNVHQEWVLNFGDILASGSSFDKKMWICCWRHTFLLF